MSLFEVGYAIAIGKTHIWCKYWTQLYANLFRRFKELKFLFPNIGYCNHTIQAIVDGFLVDRPFEKSHSGIFTRGLD